MPLREMIHDKIVSCERTTPIADVAKTMKDKNVGAVLVCEGEKPVGIVTDRDLVMRCLCDKVDVSETVETVMTDTVDTVSEDQGIQDVISCMKDYGVRRVPIVDKAGKAIGLLSFGDIVGLIAKELTDLSAVTPLEEHLGDQIKKAA